MKIRSYTIILCLFSCVFAKGQLVYRKNTIQAGIYYIGINSKVNAGLGYTVNYTRHFNKNINSIESRMSIINLMKYKQEDNLLFGEKLYKRRYISGDIILLHNFSKKPSHAFRVGVGPSVWYLKDGSQSFIKTFEFYGRVEAVAVTKDKIHETDFGCNLVIDYEYDCSPSISFNSRLELVKLNQLGTFFKAGFNVGYKF